MRNIFTDFRIFFSMFFCIISAIIFFFVEKQIFDNSVKLAEIHFFTKALWCCTFCLSGFSLLILKICINSLGDNNLEAQNIKILLRYLTYYPLMLIVLSLLSVTISIAKFQESKMTFFEASALLSFFLGYFIDSLPNLIEKLGDKATGKE